MTNMTKMIVGLLLGLLIGVGCWFDVPVPSPPKPLGALLVLAKSDVGKILWRVSCTRNLHPQTIFPSTHFQVLNGNPEHLQVVVGNS